MVKAAKFRDLKCDDFMSAAAGRLAAEMGLGQAACWAWAAHTAGTTDLVAMEHIASVAVTAYFDRIGEMHDQAEEALEERE